MLRCALLLVACLLAAAPVLAQTPPSSYSAATQPLDGADAVLMDQGSGCAAHLQPCVTKQSSSLRVGQPFQSSSAPTVPFQYQQWIDTSLSPPQLKMYIGTTWYLVASLSSTTGVSFNVPASAVVGLGTIAVQNANAVAITGGSITGIPSPVNATDVATKTYVDNAALSIVQQQSVNWACAAILPNTPTYGNGSLGVGATLTAGSNSTLTCDGNVVALNDRVLVKNQADGTQNGVYSLTTAGGGVPWILTRAADWDQAAEMKTGSYFFVATGTANKSTAWTLQTAQPVVVGATPLTFQQFSASNTYTNGTGLSLVGSTFSITATGIGAASYGSATQVATFTANAQGQMTTASNVAISLPASAISSGQLALARGGTGSDLSATGGASFFLKQNGVGAAITSVRPAAADLSNGTIGSGSVLLASGTTGSGSVVLASSPTITTPIFSGIGGSGGNNFVCINTAGGSVSSSGTACVTGSTGSGAYVQATSPTLVSPVLATPLISGLGSASQDGYLCWGSGTGTVSFNASICGPSDARLKTNWGDVAGLSAIMPLHPGTFDWIDPYQAKQGRQIGLAAQDVAKVIPEAVHIGGDRIIHLAYGRTRTVRNIQSVDYSKLVVPLIKAVQEQQHEIETLRSSIMSLNR